MYYEDTVADGIIPNQGQRYRGAEGAQAPHFDSKGAKNSQKYRDMAELILKIVARLKA